MGRDVGPEIHAEQAHERSYDSECELKSPVAALLRIW
jgi:hypothetical protein